jgi:CRP-like cAMP-binding protein
MKFPMLKNQQPQETFEAGQVIFAKGQQGDSAYIVAEGVVEIRDGDTVIDLVNEGEVFGEMALIDKGPRSAAAVAGTGCRVVRIDEKRFLFLVQQTPFFALQMMQLLVERVRKQMSRAEQPS